MTIERSLRGIAGTVVLLSLALAWAGGQADLARPSWLWLTAFVALNLLQSAFSDWCPMMSLLRRLGLGSCSAADPATGCGRPLPPTPRLGAGGRR